MSTLVPLASQIEFSKSESDRGKQAKKRGEPTEKGTQTRLAPRAEQYVDSAARCFDVRASQGVLIATCLFYIETQCMELGDFVFG